MNHSTSLNNIKYFRKNISTWGQNNFTNFPWRLTKNKWYALVAEIMLQRTKAEQVEPVYFQFISNYKTPLDYLNDTGANIFKNLGLMERNNNLISLNKFILENGIPDDKEQLLNLPGVGDYIASAFLSLHLDIRSFLIDSNIVRVYGRFFGFETGPETRRKKWIKELANNITPKKKHRNYNYALIDFSREICKPKPNCEICPVRKKCTYYKSYQIQLNKTRP